MEVLHGDPARLFREVSGLIHPADGGGRYASWTFRRLLAHRGITPSMGRKGDGGARPRVRLGRDPGDNAPVESWFSSLKTDLVEGRRFRTRAGARAAVFDCIKVFYNRQVRHSALGYATPAEFATIVRAA